ncbi:MAG: hypothetical protein NC548_40045 [Lachnospiraceae bacterium]|nr:hypothetical protein [Lachnospiraceae bacterium]MCM1232959.1 hypothetical protein [Ruminococcus flavefaciens]
METILRWVVSIAGAAIVSGLVTYHFQKKRDESSPSDVYRCNCYRCKKLVHATTDGFIYCDKFGYARHCLMIGCKDFVHETKPKGKGDNQNG